MRELLPLREGRIAMPDANRTVAQHYVPRFLLQHFVGSSGKLHTFDKHLERVWAATPINTFYENRFNEAVSDAGLVMSTEASHGKLETIAAPVIKRLLDGQPPQQLEAKDRESLAAFVAVLHMRGPAKRAFLIEQQRNHRSLFPNQVIPQQFAEQMGMLTDEEARSFSLDVPFSVGSSLVPHVTSKFMMLSVAYPGSTFLIGDSPVALYNGIRSPDYGNLGFAVPGIEIHLPLSATVMLSCVDPVLVELASKKSTALASAVRSGSRVKLTPENMLRYNSLQVRWAERFVASQSQDFSLVNRMLTENQKFRNSVRPRMDIGGPQPTVHAKDWNPTAKRDNPNNTQ